MRIRTLRTVVLAALTLSFLLPAMASARGRYGHDDRNRQGGHARYADRGFITVTNDNFTELQVLVDRKVVGTVGPQRTAKFGPFEEGRHRVKVRYICDRLRFPVLKERVEIDGRHPVRLRAPLMDAAIVNLDNAWVEPMVVTLNGRTIDRVPANSKKLVKIPNAFGTLQFVTPQGAVAARQSIRLDGLEKGSLTLIPPAQGTVSITNPSRSHTLDVLCARGRVIATVPPASTRRLDQKAGYVALTAAYRGESIDKANVLASPWDRSQWVIDLPDFAPLAVRNPNPFAVDVYAGGQLLGRIEGRDRAYFTEVPVGWTQIEVLGGRRGRTVASLSVEVDPLSGGLLSVPRLATNDGRGSYTTECERTSGSSYSSSRETRRYASRRW